VSVDLPARGVRRLELGCADPERIVNFYAAVLGWVVIAEPGGVFSGWVGDRLAARVSTGGSGWRVVFAGGGARAVRDGAEVDAGRVLHGPWAPAPRSGEPCWVELVGVSGADGEYAAALGWSCREPDAEFSVFEVDSRPVAGRLRPDAGVGAGWLCYFAVPDVAAALGVAEQWGGSVVAQPREVATGVVAAVRDPAGGVCAVLEDPKGWGGSLG
jgi:uncharacterized protein